MFECAHGRIRQSHAKEDKRPVQHSKKKGCKVFIRFYCSKSDENRNVCTITAAHTEHNHIMTRDMFLQESNKIEEEEELESIREYIDLNVKASQIRQHVRDKFSKPGISVSHVRYMMKKLQGPDTIKEDLASFLESIETDGGNIEVMLDSNGKVRVLTVQTVEMKRAVLGVNPDMFLFDTTFGYCQEGYKLAAFCYSNSVSDRGELAFLVFLSDETADSMEFAFKSFKKSLLKCPKYVMVDKDFTELSTIAKVLPTALALICQFHVLKYLRTLISTARAYDRDVKIDEEKKRMIMNIIRDMLYALTEDVVKSKLDEFHREVAGLEVRVGFGKVAYYTNLSDYFEKNWVSCSEKWLTYERLRLHGIEDVNTNNILERMWRTLKDYLKQSTSASLGVERAVILLVKFSDNHLRENYTWHLRNEVRISCSDAELSSEYSNAAKELNERGMKKFKESVDLLVKREESMKMFKSESPFIVRETFACSREASEHFNTSRHDAKSDSMMKNNENFKDYTIYDFRCTCSWSIRNCAPCRHVLFVRRSQSLPLFECTLFNARFWRIRNSDLLVKTEDSGIKASFDSDNVNIDKEFVEDPLDVESKILERREKYRILRPVLDRLLEAMLRCGSLRVQNYEKELEAMIVNVKNGKSLMVDVLENVNKECDVLNKTVQVENNNMYVHASVNEDSQKDCNTKIIKEKYDLTWHMKSKIGRAGRPRESKVKFSGTKDKRTKKRKSKTLYETEERKQTNSFNEIEVKRLKLDVEENSMPNRSNILVCSFPYDKSRPKQYGVYLNEYDCLRPGRLISNAIIDFEFRCLQPGGPSGQTVWLIGDYFSQQLNDWWRCPTIKKQVEASKVFSKDGVSLLVMAWCEKSHYFCIVGVLDDSKPVIYTLESIGGYPLPKGIEVLSSFMQEARAVRRLDRVPIEAFTLAVPKQRVASNDCGLFLIHNARMILRDPDDFLSRAKSGSLIDWYDSEVVSSHREDLAARLRLLSKEQGNLNALHLATTGGALSNKNDDQVVI